MTDKKTITGEIISDTELWYPRLSALDENRIRTRRNSQNRNVKQIVGHLIDSASNNTHRIIHLQNLTSPLEFPNYVHDGNNDRWISIQDYENENWTNMLMLWRSSLLHLCHVINNIDETKLGNEWIAGPGIKITLGDMVNDFGRHLRLHLSEIDDLLTDGSV